ncbi:MAG: DUF4968 domain-containing protein, partial [Tannerella sp.]|nr:DUF4968 domain-containing protein [Tannerella sp.]
MRNLKNSLWMFVCLCLFSCAKQSYENTPDGIIIHLQQKQSADAGKVRLQVVNDRVIRVSATPEKQFSKEKSLIIVPQAENRRSFTAEETEQQIILNTAVLQVIVDRNTGEVVFADKNGNAILRENAGGGKTFTPVTVEGTKGYALRQVFESPEDEAFYGLGQHQSDEFNYKGKNETLLQYNTKVSIPFILSNKNYGILWDNYSLSRFGDPREYAQLNENFKLFDAGGKEGGLTAVYTPVSKDMDPVERTESTICYEDIKTIKNLPEGFPLSGSSVEYTGEIES